MAEHGGHGAPAPSRRDLRARSGDAATSRRPGAVGSVLRHPVVRRWLPRTAVLTCLATATIAVPVADGLADRQITPEAVAVEATGLPTAAEVLSAPGQYQTPTSLLQAVRGTAQVADAVSRSIEREPLPGCDGAADTSSENGLIPASDLCTLWDGTHMLRGDAAVALSELNLNYRVAFGRDLCLTDSYRSLASQRRLAWTKPGLAATPGRSNHGWGLAIDLCGTETNSSAAMTWLRENGPTYGWLNPAWAQRGGSGPYEPWHWEYAPGTSGMGTNWDER